MLARIAAMAALFAVVGCAGLEPVGRNAERAPAPPAEGPISPRPEAAPSRADPVRPAPGPAATPAPTPSTQAPPVAAPQVSVAPPPPAPSRADDDEIVVPGAVERQVPAPAGDPRSMAQRMEDIRAWDQCVTAVQSAFDSDPMRPQLELPEEYCARSLGMADRTAVPESRRQRNR